MRVIQRPLARFDLIEEADFIEQVYNLDRAKAFLFAANETFQQLAAMPLMGRCAP